MSGKVTVIIRKHVLTPERSLSLVYPEEQYIYPAQLLFEDQCKSDCDLGNLFYIHKHGKKEHVYCWVLHGTFIKSGIANAYLKDRIDFSFVQAPKSQIIFTH